MDEQPVTGEPRYLLVANAAAGSVDREAVGAALVGLAAHGTVALVWSEEVSDVPHAVARHPGSVPVLLGGDGTISSAVSALLEAGSADRPIGVVPTGTGNDFARAVGIPLDPYEAASAVVDGRPRELSALTVTLGSNDSDDSDDSGHSGHSQDTRIGINAVHVGIGAAASRRASDWKQFLGPTAYPIAAAVTGSTAQAAQLMVTSDDEVLFEGTSAMLAVVLGRSIGGGTELADSSLTDDEADVLVAQGGSLTDRVALARALLSSDPGSTKGVASMSVRRLIVESDQPVPVNVDGEDVGDRTRVDIEVLPRAWTLLGPAGS